MDGTVQRVEWDSAEGWVGQCRGLGGTVQRVGWDSAEGWVGQRRGLGGTVRIAPPNPEPQHHVLATCFSRSSFASCCLDWLSEAKPREPTAAWK